MAKKPFERTNLTLPDADRAFLRELGGGNISEGVREAVRRVKFEPDKGGRPRKNAEATNENVRISLRGNSNGQ